MTERNLQTIGHRYHWINFNFLAGSHCQRDKAATYAGHFERSRACHNVEHWYGRGHVTMWNTGMVEGMSQCGTLVFSR